MHERVHMQKKITCLAMIAASFISMTFGVDLFSVRMEAETPKENKMRYDQGGNRLTTMVTAQELFEMCREGGDCQGPKKAFMLKYAGREILEGSKASEKPLTSFESIASHAEINFAKARTIHTHIKNATVYDVDSSMQDCKTPQQLFREVRLRVREAGGFIESMQVRFGSFVINENTDAAKLEFREFETSAIHAYVDCVEKVDVPRPQPVQKSRFVHNRYVSMEAKTPKENKMSYDQGGHRLTTMVTAKELFEMCREGGDCQGPKKAFMLKYAGREILEGSKASEKPLTSFESTDSFAEIDFAKARTIHTHIKNMYVYNPDSSMQDCKTPKQLFQQARSRVRDAGRHVDFMTIRFGDFVIKENTDAVKLEFREFDTDATHAYVDCVENKHVPKQQSSNNDDAEAAEGFLHVLIGLLKIFK